MIYDLILRLINLPNPFHMESIDFPIDVENCPRSNCPNWLHIPIAEIDTISEHINITLPQLSSDQIEELYLLTGGPYVASQASFYITLLRKLEVQEMVQEGSITSMEDYQAACNEFPKTTMIHARFVKGNTIIVML